MVHRGAGWPIYHARTMHSIAPRGKPQQPTYNDKDKDKDKQKDKDRGKDKDKDKDKVHRRPNICYIFEKQGV